MKYEINFKRLKNTRLKNCPCALLYNDDNKCPCKHFVNTGECRCGVFKKIEDNVITHEYKDRSLGALFK